MRVRLPHAVVFITCNKAQSCAQLLHDAVFVCKQLNDSMTEEAAEETVYSVHTHLFTKHTP